MLVNPLAFPDDSQFARSDDGTEPIYPNASVGINRILGMFKNFALVDTKPRWHMFLFNAYTVMRNIMNDVKNKTSIQKKDLPGMFDMEMASTLTYIEGYLSQFRLEKPATVAVYFPDYSHIPSEIRRNLQGDKLAIFEAYEELRKSISPRPMITHIDNVTVRITVPAGNKNQYPHDTLSGWIKEHAIDKHTGYDWGEGIFILTHVPLDLHMVNKVPWLQLAESYQGIIKLPNEFGTKLVPKDTNIPFTSVTHRVFGDSLQIVPMVGGKKRKGLITLADKHKWIRCSLEMIVRDIRTETGIPYSEVNKIKF